jgi:Rad3-related DNA helicase
MAEAVLRAFEERRHLLVEAGTGTGQDSGLSRPRDCGGHRARRARHHLDGHEESAEQLMEKDIPFPATRAAEKFTAAYMKGRNNYACLQRIKRAESRPSSTDSTTWITSTKCATGRATRRRATAPSCTSCPKTSPSGAHRRALGNLPGAEMS